MKTTISIISLISFALIFASCEGKKVGQFQSMIANQPIAIGYDADLQLNPGQEVYLHEYTNGWGLASPGDTSGVLAIFVNEVTEPAEFFTGNKVGQFKAKNGAGQYSVGYDADLQLNPGQEVYLHEYTNGWGLASPGDTFGIKVIFVR